MVLFPLLSDETAMGFARGLKTLLASYCTIARNLIDSSSRVFVLLLMTLKNAFYIDQFFKSAVAGCELHVKRRKVLMIRVYSV